MSHGATATPAAAPSGGMKGLVAVAIVVVAILILVVSLYSSRKDEPEETAGGTTDTTASVNTPPAEPAEWKPCQGAWDFRTPEIPPQGLPVYLCQGWKDWPKGGKITITTPSGEVLHDAPGQKNNWGYQPDGLYTIKADPEGEPREVQLYNRW